MVTRFQIFNFTKASQFNLPQFYYADLLYVMAAHEPKQR